MGRAWLDTHLSPEAAERARMVSPVLCRYCGPRRERKLSIVPEGRCSTKRVSLEAVCTFSDFSFLSPLGTMVFLKEGGINFWVGVCSLSCKRWQKLPPLWAKAGLGKRRGFLCGRFKASSLPSGYDSPYEGRKHKHSICCTCTFKLCHQDFQG